MARILCVDDQEEMGRLYVNMLRARGLDGTACKSGEEALELLSSGEFSLLLTDCAMPGMDGFRLAAKARELRSGLPILFISGDERYANMAQGFDQPSGFITKPVDMGLLAISAIELISRGIERPFSLRPGTGEPITGMAGEGASGSKRTEGSFVDQSSKSTPGDDSPTD